MEALPNNVEAAITVIENAQSTIDAFDLATLTALKDCLADPEHGPLLRGRLMQSHRKVQLMFEFIGMGSLYASTAIATAPHPTSIESDPSPQSGEARARRPAAKSFDYTIFYAVSSKRKMRPVSQSDLFELLKTFQPRTKRGSLTTKLNRLKEAELLSWQYADDIQITEDGRAKMQENSRHLSDQDKSDIKTAFKTAWHMDVDLA